MSSAAGDRLTSTLTDHADSISATTRVDADTVALLRLIHGDPVHERDRAKIVGTIVAAGREHRLRFVDPNVVRDRLAESVYPRCIGPVYAALLHQGVLEPVGWTTSRDKGGHNAGKPLRLYRLNELVADRLNELVADG